MYQQPSVVSTNLYIFFNSILTFSFPNLELLTALIICVTIYCLNILYYCACHSNCITFMRFSEIKTTW